MVIWRGREVLRNPSNAELAQLARAAATARDATRSATWSSSAPGPAGLAAAVYGASEGLDTVALDARRHRRPGRRRRRGSRTTSASRPASPAPSWPSAPTIQAREVRRRAHDPAPARRRSSSATVTTRSGSTTARSSRTRAVVIATGARYRRLPVPRLEEFEGTSVYYAATLDGGPAVPRRPVAVVGGGNSAGQAALFLAGTRPRVRLIVREHDAGREHVALPRRPHRATRRTSRCCCTPRCASCAATDALEALVVEDHADRRAASASRRARCSSSSGPRRTPTGCGDEVALDERRLRPDRAGVPAAATRPTTGVPLLLETSRPACSPSATCAAARSSGWPRRSARARWRSAWSTSGPGDRARGAAVVHTQTKVSSK